jgi:hypothetical protein
VPKAAALECALAVSLMAGPLSIGPLVSSKVRAALGCFVS